MNMPPDFQVIEKLKDILRSSDLTKLTRKEVRKQLEQSLGCSFSTPEWKQRIKKEIEEFVNLSAQDQPIDSNDNIHSHSNSSHSPQSQGSNHSHTNGSNYNGNGYNNQNQNNNKRKKMNDGRYQGNTNGNNNNNNNGNGGGSYYADRRKPKLQSNRQLIQKSDKDNSHYMKLPGDGPPKRVIMHKFRGRKYVGFREYYEKNGQELPTKKGINLTEEQWEFVVKHIQDIDNQVKSMR